MDGPTWSVDGSVEALGEDLRRAVGRFVRAVRTDIGTPKTARSEALLLLERQWGMNITTLARMRNVSHQSMRVVVGQLAIDGLVARTPDPADRRSWIFCLTTLGRDAIARERQMRTSRIDQLVHTHVSVSERAALRYAVEILDGSAPLPRIERR